MITTLGSIHIKRYLAQFVPSIAEAIAFGIGNQAETVDDTSLQLEAVRNNLDLVSYDFVGDRLIFRTTVPSDFIGTIYEVGVYSLSDDPSVGNYGSRNVTTFDSATEDWVDPTDGITSAIFANAATRIGADSLNHTPAASATSTSALRGLSLDFSGNSTSDTFIIAFNTANANTNSVVVNFLTDSANYYTATITTQAQSAGYKIVDIQKGSLTVTGAPDWSNITEVQVSTTSKSSGASDVEYDSIRIEDRDSGNQDYILVAREVLATPIVAIDGQEQDIEFSLSINI